MDTQNEALEKVTPFNHGNVSIIHVKFLGVYFLPKIICFFSPLKKRFFFLTPELAPQRGWNTKIRKANWQRIPGEAVVGRGGWKQGLGLKDDLGWDD